MTSKGPVGRLVWSPSEARKASTNLMQFVEIARAKGAPADLVDGNGDLRYDALHAWSIAEAGAFWESVAAFAGVTGVGLGDAGTTPSAIAPPADMDGAFFRAAHLSYAENLLSAGGDGEQRTMEGREAIVWWDENGRAGSYSRGELAAEVRRVAGGLRSLGVNPGDVVAGVLTNGPEAVVAMLATAAVGATWTGCSPDLGAEALVERVGSSEATVLFAVPGYRRQGRWCGCADAIGALVDALPTLLAVVWTKPPEEDGAPSSDTRVTYRWDEFQGEAGEAAEFERFPFDQPLLILYSSGTTGKPKRFVHGAGGTLLQHLKEHVLHCDVRPEDRVFFYTTTGWMMWNWLVGCLATGACIVLYDGAPLHPSPGSEAGGPDILWTLAETERLTHFGAGATYYEACAAKGVVPKESHDLSSLRMILSTGSPLREESFDYVYSSVSDDVHLASISGGTDIVSCFVLGLPTAPVYAGEIQVAGLGMDVDVRIGGRSGLPGEVGELACGSPFPSMPLRFLGDFNHSAYRAAYFESEPDFWTHGDLIERRESGGLVIHGRSDAILNPHGVRIGPEELYATLRKIPEIEEAVAVGWRGARPPTTEQIVLVVVLAEGSTLDDELESTIRDRLESERTRFHVPRVILDVARLPRTHSGKVSELAVRDAVHGLAPRNVDSLVDPECLEGLADHPALTALTT